MLEYHEWIGFCHVLVVLDIVHQVFQQKDAPSNMPLADAANQTGVLDFGTSSTKNANKGHEEVATDELSKRLEMYAQAGSNAGFGNNNRSETLRLN